MLVVRVCLVLSLVHMSWSQWLSTEESNAQMIMNNASEYLMMGYSSDANPCDDFYQYACGDWSYNTWSMQNVDDEFERSAHMTKTKLFEAISNIDTTSPNNWFIPEYKLSVATFFKQCLTDNVTKTDVVLQLFEGLTRIIGDSPIFSVEGRQELEKENIWYLLGKIKRDLVADVFFYTGADVLDRGCLGQVPVLRFTPAIADAGNFMNQTETVDQILAIAEMLNIQVNESTVEEDVADMIQFEQQLMWFLNETETEREANLWGTTTTTAVPAVGNQTVGNQTFTITGEENWNGPVNPGDDIMSEYDPIGMAKLMAINPNISWSDFFMGLFSNEQLMMFDESSMVVIIQNHDFFRKLSDLVQNTDIEVIFNYIFWKAMDNYGRYISMTSSTVGDSSVQSVQDTCLSTVMELFPAAATKILFDYNGWDIDAWRGDVEIMADTVFSAFKFLIMTNDQLNTVDKSLIMKKVSGIKFSSGLPDWLNDDYAMNEHTINFNSTYSAYENLLEINANRFEKELDKLVRGITYEDPEPILVADSYYWNMTISNFAGLALPPLYHPDYPLSMKYGFLGAAIGHELMKAFDFNNIYEGIQYGNGATKWLNMNTVQSFSNKKQCLLKQFKSYCAKEKEQCDFGAEVVNELLADIDGLKIAFVAYKFASQMLGEPESIPNFSLMTDDQIFFLSNARAWCSSEKSTEQFSEMNLNPHAPSKARIVASMRNFPTFAETFHCPVGSTYAPKKICDTWGSVDEE